MAKSIDVIAFSKVQSAKCKVQIALAKLSAGNTSNVKSLGAGVSELKIPFGPGYRVYFGWDGPYLVILLGGGTKQRQALDIAKAKTFWEHYQIGKLH